MSDGSTEGRQAGSGLHTAQAETDRVRAEADTVPEVAISQDAHRDAAELVARNAAYIQDAVERAQFNAKVRADRERAFESGSSQKSSVLRAKLLSERKAPSNATFGVGIASLLLVIGCIAGGVYFFSSQNGGAPATPPGAVATATPPAKSSDVSDPDKILSTINVDSAPAHDETAVQPEAADGKPSVIGALGGDAPGAGTGATPPEQSRNFSGAALNNEGGRSHAGKSAPVEGVLTTPRGGVGTGMGSKSAHP